MWFSMNVSEKSCSIITDHNANVTNVTDHKENIITITDYSEKW